LVGITEVPFRNPDVVSHDLVPVDVPLPFLVTVPQRLKASTRLHLVQGGHVPASVGILLGFLLDVLFVSDPLVERVAC
jgi:hypothetical protein